MSRRLLLALPLTVLASLAIVLALVGLSRDQGSPDAVRPAPPLRGTARPAGIPPHLFTLPDETGRDVHLANLRGRPVALLFACTTCADGALAAQQMRGALDHAPAAAGLAVTTDSRADTPARRARFLAAAHLHGRVPFLAGSPGELARVYREYAVARRGVTVVVLDANGRQRVSFSTDTLTPEDLAHDLRALS